MSAIVRSTFPAYSNWLWYDFGYRRLITGIGGCPVLRSTTGDIGPVLFLPLDVVPAAVGDKEPVAQTRNGAMTRIPPDRYFASPPVETSQPPGGEPVEPPPVVIPPEPPPIDPPIDPPPIDPPPVDPPPPVVKPTYKIKTITRTKAFPTVVFFGVVAGLPGKLVSPGGYREQTFTTGNKPEFGQGGTEAGAGIIAGDHTLIIGNDSFIIAVDGEFTMIEFEPTTDAPQVNDAAIATGYMDLSRALRVLAAANEIARRVVGRDVFRIER